MEEVDDKMNVIDDFMPDAVVVDAGDFPTNRHCLHWIESSTRIVCCDGAAADLEASGRVPWRIVGDCDSISPLLKEKYADRLRCFEEQETNDQTKAVRYLAGRGLRKIAIVGATGKREDHTLGNVSLLIEYLKQGIEARIYTDHGVFIPVRDKIEMRVGVGTQVSIFNFGASDMTGRGLRYPLRDFDSWWQGTLNESVSPTVTIRARGEFLVFVNY